MPHWPGGISFFLGVWRAGRNKLVPNIHWQRTFFLVLKPRVEFWGTSRRPQERGVARIGFYLCHGSVRGSWRHGYL